MGQLGISFEKATHIYIYIDKFATQISELINKNTPRIFPDGQIDGRDSLVNFQDAQTI